MEVESFVAVSSDSMSTGKTSGATGPGEIELRKADSADIDHINNLIAVAMDTWELANRVKRISLPLYRYQPGDLAHMQLVIAQAGNGRVPGVAALEEPYRTDNLDGHSISLLHGIYVAPDRHRQGIGRRLLKKIEDMALSQGTDALLIKARPEVIPFFKASGFEELPTRDCRRDYPYQLRKCFARAAQFDPVPRTEC